MSGLNLVRNVLAIKGAVDLIRGDRDKSITTKQQVSKPRESDGMMSVQKTKIVYREKPKTVPRLLIIGHGRHGKDTLAEIFNRDYGMTFMASSMAASQIFIYEKLKKKYGYKNPVECFEDRSKHRAEWYDLICWYNRDDKARLAKEIMTVSNCYVGMRDESEIQECLTHGVFDLVIWVDASSRLPKEPKDSFNIRMRNADILILNNAELEEFEVKAKRLGDLIFNA